MSPEFSHEQPKVTAYAEAKSFAPERLATSLDDLRGKNVLLSDGSTSMANCRAIELVTTLIAAKDLNGIANNLGVEVVGGGYVSWVTTDLGIDINRLIRDEEVIEKLTEIFPNVLFDGKTTAFLPPHALKMPVSGLTLREVNLKAREALILGAAKLCQIETPNISVVGFEDIDVRSEISLGQMLEQNNHSEKHTVIKFTCPDCSRQLQTPTEHGILSTGEVVKTTGAHIKCRGARGVMNGIKNGNLLNEPISELIKLGFYISGKGIYQLTTQVLDKENDALLVRNYSNSRGTIKEILGTWEGTIGVTNRFYFDEKRELSGRDFIKKLRENPLLIQSIHDQSILANVDRDIYLPL